MIQAVNHINLVVSNLDKSVEFYSNLLGFKEVRRAHLKGKWLDNIVGLEEVVADVVYLIAPLGEPRLELLCYKSPKGINVFKNSLANTIGLRHLAFQVKNIYLAVEKLKEAGVRIISEPTSVPPNTITHDEGHKTLCYFLDPDGILLEFAEYL